MDVSQILDRHRRMIEVGFWVIYLATNALVEAFSVITEYARIDRQLADWEPFSWEFSSAFMTGLLIIGVARLNHVARFRSDDWLRPLIVHLAATVPFSFIHVAGMVGMRKLIYLAYGRTYDFGPLATEIPYEFRKDFVTYWFILGILYLWQHIRFLNAAQPVSADDASQPVDRLVARKRGREFLISMRDVDWIEASGNYANLHLADGVFPVRASMNELERRMDPQRFARVHRSHIVNLDSVAEIRPTTSGDHVILMKDGAELRFSRRYRAALKDRLGP